MRDSVPEHWLEFRDPRGWFLVHYPPSWVLSSSPAGPLLSPPNEAGVLSLNGVWSDPPEGGTAAAASELRRGLRQPRRERPLKPLDLPYESLGLEGECRPATECEPRWWQKLLAKPLWRRWRGWAIHHGPIWVHARYVQADERDPESANLAQMILHTLEITEEPAVSPARFAERVLELARKRFPLVPAEASEEFQIKMGGSQVNLHNVYRAYVNSPDQFDELVLRILTTVVQVQEWGQQQTEPPLDAVRDRILPMPYPVEVWEQQFPNFVGSPWVAELAVLYVVDEPQAYWFIRDELLKVWNVTSDELHDIALGNLDRYFAENPQQLTLAGEDSGPRLVLPTRSDAYNASRLLSRRFYEGLREHLGDEFVIGIPSRDFFVAVSLGAPEILDRVRRRVAADYSQMDHPLTERLLRATPDGIAEFHEDL